MPAGGLGHQFASLIILRLYGIILHQRSAREAHGLNENLALWFLETLNEPKARTESIGAFSGIPVPHQIPAASSPSQNDH
ncbi:hypothetical protein ElyMa_004446000 [Elysia marginata]|uniref:Uncharacterized protein n=1 Tax=Elysia marginata TaxID=1093978 RepID=A0AAV4HDZ5_9GAST|nr:hypothetical protein ElyMa_004446000 [Elysia marginata]